MVLKTTDWYFSKIIRNRKYLQPIRLLFTGWWSCDNGDLLKSEAFQKTSNKCISGHLVRSHDSCQLAQVQAFSLVNSSVKVNIIATSFSGRYQAFFGSLSRKIKQTESNFACFIVIQVLNVPNLKSDWFGVVIR